MLPRPSARLICVPFVNPFISNTCGLFFSLAALFHSRSLCFQWFADSFAKYPGGGGIQTALGHRDRLLRWLFSRRSSTGDGSERESRQVHVAAREDYAQLWRRAIAPLRQPET